MQGFLEKLVHHEDLTIEEMREATQRCFSESTTNIEIAAFLTALRSKGEIPDEIAGMAEVIQAKSPLSDIQIDQVMDNCGTGGDHSHSFNISTTSAFVIAGAGVTVAKHGNRSISSQTGSADVLEALGVSLTLSKDHIEELLHENKIAFLYAPHVHKRLDFFTTVRRSLGIPTIFNMIGPLTNPISLDSQFLGVYHPKILPTMAESLLKLGRKRALVVNGAGSMDEASLAGENQFVLLENGKLHSFTLHPEEVGLPVYSNEEIRGGNVEKNANILLGVLKGEQSPYLDTVLFNAGLALYAHGNAQTIQEGIEQARESIDSGQALERLQKLIDYSQNVQMGC